MLLQLQRLGPGASSFARGGFRLLLWANLSLRCHSGAGVRRCRGWGALIERARFWALWRRLGWAGKGDAPSSRRRINLATGCCFLGSLLCFCFGGPASLLLVGGLAGRGHGGGIRGPSGQIVGIRMWWTRLEKAADWGRRRRRLLWKRTLLGDFGARIHDGCWELRAAVVGSSVHGGQGVKGHLAGANGAS